MLVENRDITAARMTAEQIAEAQRLARREWEAHHLDQIRRSALPAPRNPHHDDDGPHTASTAR